MLTQSEENFIKAVYSLESAGETDWVGTSALDRHLEQKPASVTNMAQKLARSQNPMLEYVPYRGVKLTQTGEKVALEVIRHHRLIELYLSEQLGVPWDQVHDEAEKLEHVISENLEDRMAAALNDISVDPHGSPIPTKDGHMPKQDAVPLCRVAPVTKVTVVEVDDRDPDLLRYLGEMNLYPGQSFTLLGQEAFGKSLQIEIDGKRHSLGEEAIPALSVKPAGKAK